MVSFVAKVKFCHGCSVVEIIINQWGKATTLTCKWTAGNTQVFAFINTNLLSQAIFFYR